MLAVVLTALALVAAGCGDDDNGDAATTVTDDATSSTDTTDGGDGTSSSTGSTASTSSSTTGGTDTTLPGEDFDGFVGDGDVVAVVGVAHDDVLNVRAGPGADQDIVTTAGPTADDLVGTGRARLLSSSIWYEVTVGGVTGWVNSSFVAFQGGVDDATSEFLGGDPPITAETMADLGQEVADGFASTDPASNVVQSVAPSVGDLGEVTYDVIGLGDDAVAGYRLHVFGTPDEGGEGFGLKSIERTTFCTRGLSGELCV
jgi:hypothetical protein